MSEPSTPAGGPPIPADHDTRRALFTRLGSDEAFSREGTKSRAKVTVVGAGAVGLAAAFAILNQGVASELALVDVAEEKLRGEAMDLIHGSAFSKRCVIRSSSDYAVSAGSHLVVLTAGARQREGETRLNLVARNLEIFKGIVPQIVHHSPNTTICVVSNPVDIMTSVTARLAGLPPGRVFGSGTALDSSRFRTLVAERLGVDARSVHGMILGEHGDSSVACWSKLNVAGVRLRDLNPDLGRTEPGADPENWAGIHRAVVQSAYEIIRAKGYTNWAIGMTCASIAEAVLRNEFRVLPLSVPAAGRYGIAADLAATGGVPVHLSLPAVLGSEGVRDVLNPPLDEVEEAALRTSAEAIGKVQSELAW